MPQTKRSRAPKPAPAAVEATTASFDTADTRVAVWVKEFVVQFGMITTIGTLVNVRRPQPRGPVTMCPECRTPEMNTRYQCPNPSCGKVVPQSEALKAIKNPDGTCSPVDPEALKAARTSDMQPNVLDLTVHPASDVD